MHSFLDPIPLSVPHSQYGAVYRNVTNEHRLCKNSDIIDKTNARSLIYDENNGAMQNNLQEKDNNIIDSRNDSNLQSCTLPSSHIMVHKIRCIDIAVQTDYADKKINDNQTTNKDSHISRCDACQSYNTKR